MINNLTELSIRNNLSEIELQKRLSKYFMEDDITDIIVSCKGLKSWSDGYILVLYFKDDKTFSIVTTVNYSEITKE